MARKKTGEDLKKSARWELILKLISERSISTQKELAEALVENGFNVAQATLSRDIKELHLVKSVKPDGTYAYQAPGKSDPRKASSQFYQLFQNSVIRLDSALNQVVVHTYIGMAQAVCAAMDSMNFEEIIGTIAGDDTILVITKSEEEAKRLLKDLGEL